MKKTTILIADDSSVNRKILTDLIEQNTSYKVIQAKDGESVLKNIKDTVPNLILLDIVMPGMDGIEVARRLKKIPKFAGIPIIFITAIKNENEKIKAFDVGGIDYITKPFHKKEVLSRINAHIDLQEQYEQIIEINKETQQQLKIAGDIQNFVFLKKDQNYQHFNCSIEHIALDQVSGDYYDILQLGPDLYSIFIADITGHGMPAALYTMMLKLSLNYITARTTSAESILEELNHDIFDLLSDDMYITAAIFNLDFKKMTLSYANAAHTQSFFYSNKDKSIKLLKKPNILLGFNKNTKFKEEVIPIKSGDKLLIYTDGLFEIMNKNDVLLGVDFLKNTFKENISLKGKDFNKKLISKVLDYSKNDKFEDDVTLMNVEIK